MICSISGEAPQVPVASSKSGNVYERRLIEAYISENGSEPTTGEPLTVEDLIDLKTAQTVRPRPPSLTSIPSLLGVFQEEWDALALETYTLRHNLAQTRQELSTALYQHDAAVRVIARLTRERDEAREALSRINVGRSDRVGANGDAMQVDSAPLPDGIIAKIESTQESLSKTRRKRPIPEDWATADSIATYSVSSTSEALYPGGNVLSVDESGDLALVGGVDGVAGIYSLSENKLLHSIKGGGGAITSAVWAGSKAVIATATGRVKIVESQKEVGSFAVQAGSISALAVHPSGEILASVGHDRTYILYDLQSMNVLTQVSSDSELTCAQFHPDGHLLAAGAMDGQIKIFDAKSGSQAAIFEVGAPLESIFFSENGTWLAAVPQQSSSISIWDLRKAAEIKSLDIGSRISAIAWDYTGQFLAAAGESGITVEQYSKSSKDWTEVLKSATPASAVAWGTAGQSLVTVNNKGVVTILESKK